MAGAVLRLAARGESPSAFGRRCIPPGCVAPRSHTPGILTRPALPAGRIAGLGATPDFHHGLLRHKSWCAETLRHVRARGLQASDRGQNRSDSPALMLLYRFDIE